MTSTRPGPRCTARLVHGMTLWLLASACSSPRDSGMTPQRALDGFRDASPLVAELAEAASAVAVFVDVEGMAEGCAHTGVLLLPDGEQEDIVLRCLEEPRAPGGYRYHQLVVLRDSSQVELLRRESLDLEGFWQLAPHDERDQAGHEDAPGWVISTHRSQLLFGDQRVRQRLEPAR